jgi:hypothetical protein
MISFALETYNTTQANSFNLQFIDLESDTDKINMMTKRL